MKVLLLAGPAKVHPGKDFSLGGSWQFRRRMARDSRSAFFGNKRYDGVREIQGRVNTGRCFPEYGCRLGIFRSYQCGDSGLEYTGLLISNRPACGTQQGAVVEAYGSNDRKLRADDIRAVEPAAKARLYYRPVHSLPCEPPECQAGSHFKKG